MPSKPLMIAAIATVAATAMLPTHANAGDPGLGALFGATIGAAIGHNVNGRHGAVVGGVLGAITGASIAAESGHYRDRYYDAPSAAYYPPAPANYSSPIAYYPPAPVYYAPSPVVYRVAPVYVTRHLPHRPVYAPIVVNGRHDWRRNGHHDWR